MLHQPSGGAQGMASDIAIHAEEILRMRKLLSGIYAKHTGQDAEKIQSSLERDFFLSPAEALEFGIIDEVVTPRN